MTIIVPKLPADFPALNKYYKVVTKKEKYLNGDLSSNTMSGQENFIKMNVIIYNQNCDPWD